jgi:glycosyltransferase involved in cell wall biosynthesis
MRFIVLHHGEILSEQLWSGIPLNIIQGLKAQGHDVVAIGNLKPGTTFRGRAKGVIYRKLFNKLYLVDRDLHTSASRTPDANRRIAAAGKVEAIIAPQIGDVPFLVAEAPIITVHDATWIQLLDYYPGYERSGYARETIDGGIAMDKRGLERAAHCIFASQWAAESAHRGYGIPKDKLSVAPLGANLSRVPSREDCEAFLKRRGSETCRFLFLGKEWHRKGGDTAVAILTELERRGLPVELHIVGCMPEGKVPAFVRAHGSLWKNVPGQAQQLEELFQSCDFFMLPTRAECFGLAFCEAAAYGLPTLTTCTGGVPEVVSPDWAIAKPLPVSVTEYADWILAHYRDREAYSDASRAARAAFEQRLNWNVLCNHIVKVTGNLQDARSPQPELTR